MSLLFVSFIAGILTVLAPCILPLLPVIIGRSLTQTTTIEKDTQIKRNTPLIVCLSLALSIFVFTFLLKVSTIFIDIPQDFWKYLSATILVLFGIFGLFGDSWAVLMNKIGLAKKSNSLLGSGLQKKSIKGDIIMGAALGPVFSTCSPTYFIILATVLPASFGKGVVYLLAYIAGLCLVLFGISVLGQKFVQRLDILANPNGLFKKIISILFIIIGVLIATGADKKLQTIILDAGFFDVTKIEQKLIEQSETRETMTQNREIVTPDETENMIDSLSINPVTQTTMANKVITLHPETKKLIYTKKVVAPEISTPDGFINTGGRAINLAQYRGKKIVLLDIWTYSCINCKRTLPYLNDWYSKYKDAGLEIIGLHTPEFAFEHKLANVEQAVKDEGIKFPVVLDNDYSTWTALGNNYWPRKYIIDLDGNIIYDHIGEGGYQETEEIIQYLLQADTKISTEKNDVDRRGVKTRETYFGYERNEFIKNSLGKKGVHTLAGTPDVLSLDGMWDIQNEYVEVKSETGKIYFPFTAKHMYLVLSSPTPQVITITDENGTSKKVTVKNETLYEVFTNSTYKQTSLEITLPKGVKVFTATFG